ncbi:hypothetical protein K439DRAFT_1638279 [Ramaria rubella]|nr:hypothetical protein K439DRAFT_1638279 [Ramaria rubella]
MVNLPANGHLYRSTPTRRGASELRRHGCQRNDESVFLFGTHLFVLKHTAYKHDSTNTLFGSCAGSRRCSILRFSSTEKRFAVLL